MSHLRRLHKPSDGFWMWPVHSIPEIHKLLVFAVAHCSRVLLSGVSSLLLRQLFLVAFSAASCRFATRQARWRSALGGVLGYSWGLVSLGFTRLPLRLAAMTRQKGVRGCPAGRKVQALANVQRLAECQNGRGREETKEMQGWLVGRHEGSLDHGATKHRISLLG